MNEQEWSVRIEGTGPGPYDLDWADRVVEALEGRGPAVKVGPHEVAVRFTLAARDAEAAFREALLTFREVLPELEPVAIDVQSVVEQERQLAASNVPELLGVSEVAEALGVSKQRVAELSESGSFPAPIVRLRAGPIWERSAIARFLSQWPRRPGRPARGGRARPKP
jgi:hypothetical protein